MRAVRAGFFYNLSTTIFKLFLPARGPQGKTQGELNETEHHYSLNTDRKARFHPTLKIIIYG